LHIDTLRVFCDVVDTRSFSEAARLNRVTQSAISQQIRALEKRFDRKLLDRAPRAIQPTAAGEKLYDAAREVLARFEELLEVMREESDEAEGVVTIATIHSVGLHEIQVHLKELLRSHPKVTARVAYRRSDQIYDMVSKGEAELGLVAFPKERRELVQIPFAEDRLVVVVPPDHSFAKKKSIPLAGLDGINYVAFERDIPTRRAIDRLLREHGSQVQIVMELDNVETLKRAVEIGIGVSILPRASVRTEVAAGTLVEVEIADGNFTRPIAILLRRGRTLSKATEAVLEVFLQNDAKRLALAREAAG
jgi:DNA-binding transcriptional LysR family regulator